jgi:glucosylceramidase
MNKFPSKLASILAGVIILIQPAMAQQTVAWQCSTANAPWIDKGALPTTHWSGDQGTFIDIKGSQKLQKITGWGGCFNEKGWKAMMVLSPQERTGIMKALFDQNTGLKLNLCRTPIGSSDFGISSYSLDETKDDYSMSHFSIARDKEMLIPYIKAAMAINPKLKLWGVPWSPPSWMKDNGSLIGGSIKTDDQTMDALALYFEKYVQAYQAEKLGLTIVMPQNEPTIQNNYPTCHWTGEQLRDFVKNHLGPKFAKDTVHCDIWLGTFQNSDDSYVNPTLNDPQAMSFIKGFAFQWGGTGSCNTIHVAHPEMPLMQSETPCGHGENDWNYGQGQFDVIKDYMNAGVNSYMLWNMVLDETGMSTGGWKQCSPVVVDQTTKKITYTPQYYFFKHFAYYVKPGAYHIPSNGNFGDVVAYVNPDGETVLELRNANGEITISINFNGEGIKVTIPAHSMNTFRMTASQ